MFAAIDVVVSSLSIILMYQWHSSVYDKCLCKKCERYMLPTGELEVKMASAVESGSGATTTTSTREETVTMTATAMNEFSMDRSPSPAADLNTNHKGTLQVVVEEREMQETELQSIRRSHTTNSSRGRAISFGNDFVTEDSVDESSKNSMNFDFGVYLEYWRSGRKNSVVPKHRTLKDELMNNRYHRITEKQYTFLREKCQKYLNPDLVAKDIGIGNEICNISPGSPITIEHLIALKSYTDFDDLQRAFKRHCRRLRQGESVNSVMERNCGIAHWCRLLTECIMFWGDTMAKKQEFYCGLTARLVLRSLNQRFECPLSTTRSWDVAQRFTEDHQGIILKIKRGNARTRYFDVASISAHSEEEESLFVGSTIKITGIFAFNEVRRKWEPLKPKFFVSALAMFEQIYNGHFIDGKNAVRNLLLKLIELVNDDAATKSM